MLTLGHPLTYPTKCFIAGGCGADVYAHTQGHGDFVLFDDLGWPWQIHKCYLDLGSYDSDPCQPKPKCPAPDVYTNQEWAQELAQQSQAYKAATQEAALDRRKRPIQNLARISPDLVPTRIQICGYVQDIVEKQADKLLQKLGALGQQLVRKGLGSRQTQLTILDHNFKSYTGFADVRQIALGRGSTIMAVLHTEHIVGLGNVFLFAELDLLPIRPEK